MSDGSWRGAPDVAGRCGGLTGTGGPAWRNLALLVAGAFFMENLDGTIIATAAPRMAASFHVPAGELNLVIAAYLLALGIFIPVSGWIADRFGARLVFCGAIAVFTLASVLCARSTSLVELTATRLLQGIGGALMVPVGRLVVLRGAEKADIIRVIAYLTWPALVAPVVAPALGGAIVTYASWRWIFLVNVPLGLVALVVAFRIVPDVRTARPAGLDWQGFVLTGLGLGLAVYGLELVEGGTVPWALAGACIGAGSAVVWRAVVHLRRRTHPLLDLAILHIPTFRAASAGGSLFRLAIGAAPFLLPLQFQDGFGWSPIRSGLLVVSLFVGNIGIKPFTTPLLRRFGFRAVLGTSAAAAGVTLAACAAFTARTPVALIVVVLVASGVFRSTGFTAYNTIVFADVPQDAMSNANTLSSTVQQVTMGVSVTIGALVLHAGAWLERLAGSSGTGSGPFVVAFAVLAVVAAAASVEALLLPREAGSSLAASR